MHWRKLLNFSDNCISAVTCSLCRALPFIKKPQFILQKKILQAFKLEFIQNRAMLDSKVAAKNKKRKRRRRTRRAKIPTPAICKTKINQFKQIEPVWEHVNEQETAETVYDIVDKVLATLTITGRRKYKRMQRMLVMGLSVEYAQELLKEKAFKQRNVLMKKYPDLYKCVESNACPELKVQKLKELLPTYLNQSKLSNNKQMHLRKNSMKKEQQFAQQQEILDQAQQRKRYKKFHYSKNENDFQFQNIENYIDPNEYDYLNAMVNYFKGVEFVDNLEPLPFEVRVAIVPDGYPNTTWSVQEMMAVKSDILSKLSQQRQKNVKPEFTNCYLRSGWISIGCVDENTVDWLRFIVPQMQPWSNSCMHVIRENEHPETLLFSAFFRRSSNIPECTILQLIARENAGLQTNHWRVLNKTVYGDDIELECRLDTISAMKLKYNYYCINYGFDKVTFKEIHPRELCVKVPTPPRWPNNYQ